MTFKKKYYVLFILLISILFLVLNLKIQFSQNSSTNDFELLNDKYLKQKEINEQLINLKRFILTEGFYFYNPSLIDYNMNSLKLTELINSKALIYRFSISSCSVCVEEKIDYYLEHKHSIAHQFIVLCTDEHLFSKLTRTYLNKDVSFYLVEDDTLSSTQFNFLFPSLFLIVDKSGKILNNFLPDSIEIFLDVL